MADITDEEDEQYHADHESFGTRPGDDHRERHKKEEADEHRDDEMSKTLSLDDRHLRSMKTDRIVPIDAIFGESPLRPILMTFKI